MSYIHFIRVEGRENSPLNVYTIDFGGSDPKFLEAYLEAQELYLKEEWGAALEKFNVVTSLAPEYGPTQSFIQSIEESKKN